MKILYVCDLNKHARSQQRLETLKELGHRVEGVSWVPLGNSINQSPSLVDRLKNKLGFPLDLVNINDALTRKFNSFEPELVWVDKAHTIKPKTYKKLKAINPDINIVYYSEDDIYMRHNRSRYLTSSLPKFDVVFSTKPRNINELPILGVKNTYCIYQAFDRNIHHPLELSEEEKEHWGCDVTFIGSFELDRAKRLLYLAQKGISVRVWGINWHRWKEEHPNLKIENRPVICNEYIKVINSSKINLNFLRKINRDQHTSRSLEIPACGAFMLAERTQEHLNLFQEGIEAEFFSSDEEMLEKIKYYLTNDTDRQTIAKLGREKCLKNDYSHHGRLDEMLNYIQTRK